MDILASEKVSVLGNNGSFMRVREWSWRCPDRPSIWAELSVFTKKIDRLLVGHGKSALVIRPNSVFLKHEREGKERKVKGSSSILGKGLVLKEYATDDMQLFVYF